MMCSAALRCQVHIVQMSLIYHTLHNTLVSDSQSSSLYNYDWPAFWAGSSFTLDLDGLIPLNAVILRDPNALSFSNIEHNSGKIFYMGKNPIKLIKHIENGVYQTTRGKLNLRDLISQGQLNSCVINGNVARRYNSAKKGASPMPKGME